MGYIEDVEERGYTLGFPTKVLNHQIKPSRTGVRFPPLPFFLGVYWFRLLGERSAVLLPHALGQAKIRSKNKITFASNEVKPFARAHARKTALALA